MVSSMIEGPLIAMEIMTPDNDPDIVQLFKDICGPSHPVSSNMQFYLI